LPPPELELAQRWAQRKNKDIEQVLVDDFHVALSAMGTAHGKPKSNLAYQASRRTTGIRTRNWAKSSIAPPPSSSSGCPIRRTATSSSW
jgi:hypothetical protein